MTTQTTDIASLAADLAGVQDAIAKLKERETALKAAILERTDGPDRYAAGVLTVVVSQARTLDKDAIAAKYPAEHHPELYSLQVDVAKVRKAFAPNDLEPLEKVSAASVRLT